MLKHWPLIGLLFLIPPLVGMWWAVWTKDALKPITAGFLTGMFLFKWVTLPSLEPLRAKPFIGKEVAELKERCSKCRVVFLDFSSPEIVFYYRKGKLSDLNVKTVEKLLESKTPVLVITRENRLKKLKGVRFFKIDERRELLTKHSIVVISNYPKERFYGKG